MLYEGQGYLPCTRREPQLGQEKTLPRSESGQRPEFRLHDLQAFSWSGGIRGISIYRTVLILYLLKEQRDDLLQDSRSGATHSYGFDMLKRSTDLKEARLKLPL